jgi:putative tryptophan/tyrosine transport system substrate-binding protein
MSKGAIIRLEFRTAAGNVDRLPALAEELVQKGGIDVILAISTPAALAAHRATQTIPIVAFDSANASSAQRFGVASFPR